MDKRTRHSPEVRERKVRLVHDHAHEHGSQWGGHSIERDEGGVHRAPPVGAAG